MTAITDAMVRAAIDAALDLVYESFPGPEGQETHRGHDANGCFDAVCPFCRLVRAHDSVKHPARVLVFRAALEAGLAEVLAEATCPRGHRCIRCSIDAKRRTASTRPDTPDEIAEQTETTAALMPWQLEAMAALDGPANADAGGES